jgi:hypothetical protein
MESSENDTKTFYKLVNDQRKNPHNETNSRIVNIIEVTTPENILEVWKVHFQNLATSKDGNWSFG